MGTYEELKAAIQQVMRTNGNNEITGALLQQTLLSIVNSVGANAAFAGIATPNTNPGTADQNVYYLATEPGTYANFGGIEIAEGEAVILSNKTGNWTKTTSGFATQQQLTELDSEIGEIIISQEVFQGVALDATPNRFPLYIHSGNPFSLVVSSDAMPLAGYRFVVWYQDGSSEELKKGIQGKIGIIYDFVAAKDIIYAGIAWNASAAIYNGLLTIRINTGLSIRITSLEEKTTSLEEKTTSLEEKTTSLEEKTTSLEEKTTSLEEKIEIINTHIVVKQGVGIEAANNKIPFTLTEGETYNVNLLQDNGYCIRLINVVEYYSDGSSATVTTNANPVLTNIVRSFVAQGDILAIGFTLVGAMVFNDGEIVVSVAKDIATNYKVNLISEHLEKNKWFTNQLFEPFTYGQPSSSGFRSQDNFRISNRIPMIYERDVIIYIADNYRCFLSLYENGVFKDNTPWFDSEHPYEVQAGTEFTATVALINEDSSVVANFIEFSKALSISSYYDEVQSHFNYTGVYQGESINIKRKFLETIKLYALPSESALFDSALYSIGNQGGDIYDNKYAIVARLGTLKTDTEQQKYGVVIGDIENGGIIGEILIGVDTEKAHGNNLNIGSLYSNTDKYPLLYISDTYTPYTCYVIRLADDITSYSVIQKIQYSGELLTSPKEPTTLDWFVDVANSYIYAVSYYHPWKLRIKKFSLPETTLSEVLLTDDNELDSFEIDGIYFAQGGKIIDGKLFLGQGTKDPYMKLKVIDLAEHKVVTELPLTYEPEGMGIYNDKIAVMTPGFGIRTYEDVL